MSLVEKVEYRVQENITSSGTGGAESYPLPVIILRVQDEIHCDNGGAYCYHAQDGVHQEHEAIHIVKLVRPEGCEDEVHLYENGSKGQNSSNGDDEVGVSIPGCEGNRPSIPR